MDGLRNILNKATEAIKEEQEKLIKERLFEILGYEFDPIKEGLMRFPRLKLEHHSADQSQHYYWNDGSENGLRVISFYFPIEQDIMSKDYKMTIGFNYK